jgi:ATP adenylyltransferase
MLYAPWRDKYINSCSQKLNKSGECCVFCEIWNAKGKDEETYVLARYKHAMVLLNAYPYSGGHLLVVPSAHVSDLDACSAEVRSEIMEIVSASCAILKKELCAMGVNIGMNIGKSAGAGIPNHIHVHLVPRWEGDTNFLPIIGKVKQISVDLERVYNQLKEPFKKIQI